MNRSDAILSNFVEDPFGSQPRAPVVVVGHPRKLEVTFPQAAGMEAPWAGLGEELLPCLEFRWPLELVKVGRLTPGAQCKGAFVCSGFP